MKTTALSLSLSFGLFYLLQLNAIPIPGATEAKEAPRVVKSGGIERAFVQGAQLSAEEEKTVLALAKKQGIAKVVKISTYYMYPTTTRGISVQSAEVIKGRQVTYQVLNINGKKWSHHGASPRHGDIQLGGFWAGKPYARKQTILRVGEIDYRCNSVNGISIKEAENLLALFLEGKFGTEPNVNLRALEQVNWKKPVRLGKRGDSISVSFPHEKAGEGWFDMEVKLDGKQLTITQMLQAIP